MEFPNKQTQFKPGKSGNPEGRPRGSKNRATIVRQILEMDYLAPDEVIQTLKEEYPEIAKKLTVEEIMTIVQIRKAITESDTSAYKAVMDSAYGQPTQGINFESEKDQVTAIEFTVFDPSKKA